MLKALEIVGFKSFADKTRFEFPPGITVVVGPNGSGKSNIVDAIKWVLGEQSVKSLRGKEMADVIFNGSGARRAVNSAEITLTFNNGNNLLPIGTPEVHITRRVYRSGEGEYLINRQPSRLRDIRDLLSGTGMGSQAYSVIEQGKVDGMLQSSPRDRRVIFEEAAGISRFKLRKLEALRRLERVEQNLLRLSDIVDEVDSRLRGVRAQAGKARRYKEHTNRLQELRTQVGLVDWRRLTERLDRFQQELNSLIDQRNVRTAEAEAVEARLLETDAEISEVNEGIRRSESRMADNRERIAANETTLAHERSRGRDLEQEIARHRSQLAAMNTRAGDLQHQLRDTAEAVESAESHHQQIGRQLVERERELTELIARLDRSRGEHEQRRAAQMSELRDSASLGNQISGLESRAAAALATRERSQERLAELNRQLHRLSIELDDLHLRRDELSARLERREDRLATAQAELDDSRAQLAAARDVLVELRQRQSAAAERASVLEELQRRQEGLSSGVKEVLARSRDEAEGSFQAVHGLLADLFQVSVEAAPLVEVALGSAAQHLVIESDERLLAHLQEDSSRFSGRVGFVRLEPPHQAPPRKDIDLEGQPGVLGRADRFIETDATYVALAERLLGETWIVENLRYALDISQSAGRGLRFVTLAGELLEADGTLVVGPRHVATGLISRRSELRSLKAQLAEMETRVQEAEATTGQIQSRIEEQAGEVNTAADGHRQAAESLAEHLHKITASEERRAQLDRNRSVLQSELSDATSEHRSASESLDEARLQQRRLQEDLAETETELTTLAQQIAESEAERQARERDATEIKVELAKSEERLRNFLAQMRQFEESQQERHRAIADNHENLTECGRRERESRWNVLTAESEIAELYLKKEGFAAGTVEMVNRREELGRQRSELTTESQQARAAVRQLDEKSHAKELAAGEVQHERSSLADRLREDYGIELAALEDEPSDEEQHRREEVQQEIDELRRKIGNLGNVNLEALAELDDLDERHKTLAGQYKDLSDAKKSLERIIDKINIDSRRLFTETLQTVREHFQTLFRDLFGGGHADIVLDEEGDILESGIEIVARPPGKEPRSISLLSGGEKTLTCVALLLAIFRSRPSPFCVLDEVDAALDEANIDRFTKVLNGFLAWTQFIIVTHSKKTMTCADTIYGVTMQESGVSKQVSVRFEDVSEDGHIRQRPEPPDDESDEDEPQAA